MGWNVVMGGQIESSWTKRQTGAKRGQTGPNKANRVNTALNVAIQDQTGPYKDKRGKIRSYGAK